MSAVLFFLLYRIIPNRHVPARHALAGGILAAAVFEMMKSVFAACIRAVPTYRLVYGAFASIPIFLVWLYLCVARRAPRGGVHRVARLVAGFAGSTRRATEDTACLRRGRALAMAGGAPVALGWLREAADCPTTGFRTA